MCSSLDHALTIAIYVMVFLGIYGFVALWLIFLDAEKPKRHRQVKSYDEWGI